MEHKAWRNLIIVQSPPVQDGRNYLFFVVFRPVRFNLGGLAQIH